MLAHLIAYPVGFLTAVAAMPLAMMSRREQLMDVGAIGAKNRFIADAARELALSPLEAAQVELVLEVSFMAALVTLGLVHLWSLPWSVAAARQVKRPEAGRGAVDRGYRLFTVLTVSTILLLLLGGIASWVWVLRG